MARKKAAAAPNKPNSKPTLATNRRKRRKRTITRVKGGAEGSAKARANPAGGASAVFLESILPGFGAYAATRVAARMVYAVVQKRWPKLGKHAHALAGVASATAAWFLAPRVERLARYQDGILMGSSVAALQGVAQAYLPQKYRWLLADPKAADVGRPLAPPPPAPLDASHSGAITPAAGDDEFSYLEERLAAAERSGSRAPQTFGAPRAARTPVASSLGIAATADGGDLELDPDLLEALGDGEGVDDLYTGAFEQN